MGVPETVHSGEDRETSIEVMLLKCKMECLPEKGSWVGKQREMAT